MFILFDASLRRLPLVADQMNTLTLPFIHFSQCPQTWEHTLLRVNVIAISLEKSIKEGKERKHPHASDYIHSRY